MDIAVIGANGGIGRELLPLLADAGHTPVGVVRHERQFDAVQERGGEPRLGDLEGEFEPALDGVDAAVFTAGSGGDTGWDKTLMVDLWGARRCVDACVDRGIDRFVMISAYGAGDPATGNEDLRPYWVAKRVADDYLDQSPLDATVLRPTGLTDGEGTGHIAAAFEYRGEDVANIPRADVARTVVACLTEKTTVGQTIRLFGGATPIEAAIRPEN